MNSSDSKQSPCEILTGYIAFFVLLILSIVFYRERTCIADGAFQAYHLVNTENFSIALDRFGAVIVQIIPLLFINLHVPLEYALMAFSASFVIQNLILYLLLHLVLKQHRIALILVLYNVLMVTETFYLPTSELKQGLSLAIFSSGLLLAIPLGKYSGLKKAMVALLHASVLITAIFLHPVVIVAILFIIGYMALHENRDFRITAGWSLLIAIAAATLKFVVLRMNEYDALMYERKMNFITYFPGYFSLPGFGKFIEYCLADWYLYGLMLCAVSFFYVRKKLYRKLSWLLGFTLCYLLLVNVSFPLGVHKFYAETFYLALGIFALFPFVIELLPKIEGKYAVVVLLVIFGLRFNSIYGSRHPYSARLNWMGDMLAQHRGKFIIPEDYAPADILKMQWSVAHESLILSGLASPDSARSFIILKDTKWFDPVDTSGLFIYTPMRVIHYDRLNKHYFRPAPGYYRELPKEEMILSDFIDVKDAGGDVSLH